MIRRALAAALGLAALVLVVVGSAAPVSAQAVGVYNGVSYAYPAYSYPGLNYGYGYAYGSYPTYAYNTYAYNNVYTPVYGFNPYSYGYNTYSYASMPFYGYGYGYNYGVPPQRFINNGCKVGNYTCLRSK